VTACHELGTCRSKWGSSLAVAQWAACHQRDGRTVCFLPAARERAVMPQKDTTINAEMAEASR
jgi:hypothetical protein